MLAAPPVEAPVDLKARLLRARAPIKCRLGGRDVMLTIGGEFQAASLCAFCGEGRGAKVGWRAITAAILAAGAGLDCAVQACRRLAR